MTQQRVLADLMQAKANGLHLGNITMILEALFNAVVYLVANTPEVKK